MSDREDVLIGKISCCDFLNDFRCNQKHKASPRRAMFLAPKNKELFDKWVEALPKIRSLKPHDKVCYLHFHQEDVSSTYDHTINGQIYQLERGRPRLKPEAVPTVNLPTTEELKTLSKSSKRNVKKVIAKEMPSEAPEVLIGVQVQEFPQDCLEDITEIASGEEASYFNTDEYSSEPEFEEVQQVPDIETIYSSFYDNIQEVELPNSLWGVHRCPKRSAIFFTYMDVERLRCTKVIRIASDGSMKVFVGNRLIYELTIVDGIHTVEMLSKILTQIDTMAMQEVETDSNTAITGSHDYQLPYVDYNCDNEMNEDS